MATHWSEGLCFKKGASGAEKGLAASALMPDGQLLFDGAYGRRTFLINPC